MRVDVERGKHPEARSLLAHGYLYREIVGTLSCPGAESGRINYTLIGYSIDLAARERVNPCDVLSALAEKLLPRINIALATKAESFRWHSPCQSL